MVKEIKLRCEYDAGGRKTKVTDPLGGTNSWVYDKNDNLIKETDALGNSIINTYDKRNHLSKVTDALGNTSEYDYDGIGNIIVETDAIGNTTKYVYDAPNNLTQVKDALGNITKYKYDKNGNLQSQEDAKGYVTTYQYDSLSHLTKVEDALGHTTEYTYDKSGNITKETRMGSTSSKDQVTTYKYDKSGSLTSLTDPAGQIISYEYNEDGQIAKETAKDGTSTEYQYDKTGNIIKKLYSDKRTVKYTYDKNNRLETMTDWTGTTTYQYDAKGQKTKITDSNNQTIQYTWNKTGQKKTMTYPDGNMVQYEYDKAGNLIKVSDTRDGINTYSYNSLNQLKLKKMANGAESTYTYDDNGQLTQRLEKVGGTTKDTYSYQYDDNGNRIKEIKVSGKTTNTTSYTYDALNQLTKVIDDNATKAYTYDEFNNRLTKTETGKEKLSYTYNELNQLTQEKQGSDTKNYSYDKRGNLTTKQENGKDSISYTFDSTNMLAKVKDMDKDTITEYRYDGAGNRIQKTITKNSVIHSQTDYVVDTESFYQDTVTSKNVLTGETSDYTYGNGLISVDTNNVISYYRIDDQNSVEEIQSATGNVNSELKYDEFGTLKNPESIKTSGSLFAYTGYAYEETTGLYYAKARYYDSEQGRFISEDSYRGDISNPISLNLYTYCSNSSILNSDPSGNKIRFTQTDNFLFGFIKGAIAEFDFNVFGSLEESLVNLDAMGDLIQDIVSGKITDKELLAIGINEAVGDLHYVIKNFHIVSSKKTYSNATVYKFGKHLAGAYGEMVRAVATVVGAVKSVKALKAKIKGAGKAKNTKPSNAKGAGKTVSKASPYDLTNTHSQTLSNNQLNKLVNDIKTNGIQETIKYVEYNGKKYVVDGHHRLLAAKKLGLAEVPIEKVELPYAGYKTISDLLWVD